MEKTAKKRKEQPFFSMKYRVVSSETDASGIVHFSNHFRFFERAEEAYLAQLGLNYERFTKQFKIWLPRVKATCEYLSPLRDGDEIEIILFVKEMGKKSIAEAFEIKNITTAKLAAKGEMVNVAATLDISKAVPIPKDVASLLLRGNKKIKEKEENKESSSLSLDQS